MSSDINYRSAELVYREEPDGSGGVLEGRMVPYDEWTEINSTLEGHFLERFRPGSLTKTLTERAHKLRVLFEHGFSPMLDVQPIAALESVREEDDGPYYRAGLFEGIPQLIMSGLRAAQYGTSIGFRPVKVERNRKPEKSEHNPEGIEERSVTEAHLRELSVVTFPAYEGATAGVRSLTDEHMRKLLLRDPKTLLALLQEEEPTHSEPAPEEESEPDTGSRDTQPEMETPKVPKKDWLAPTEKEGSWLIP